MIQKASWANPLHDHSPAALLPPAPALADGCWRCEQVETEVGPAEALRPTAWIEHPETSHAPAMVLVSGLGMDAHSWQRQIPLAHLSDVHALRPPAQVLANEEGLGHFARHLEAYIEAKGLHQRPGGVVLIGSSMGGAVSLLVCARKRVPVRGLILVGSYGSAKHLNRVQRNATPLSYLAPVALIKRLARPMLLQGEAFGRFGPEEAEFMIRCIHIPSRGYLVRAAHALTRLELTAQAATVETPTLILHGTDDRVLPFAAARELAGVMPNARLASFEGAGHAFFFLDHVAVNAAIAEFVLDLAPPRNVQSDAAD